MLEFPVSCDGLVVEIWVNGEDIDTSCLDLWWMTEYPTEDDVINTNKVLIETIKAKKADKHKLFSKAKITETLNSAKEANGDIYDKAVVMFSGLVRGHPFASGNRRTAYVITKVFLEANGGEMKAIMNETVLQGVRENFYNLSEIKEWLKGNAIRPFNR